MGPWDKGHRYRVLGRDCGRSTLFFQRHLCNAVGDSRRFSSINGRVSLHLCQYYSRSIPLRGFGSHELLRSNKRVCVPYLSTPRRLVCSKAAKDTRVQRDSRKSPPAIDADTIENGVMTDIGAPLSSQPLTREELVDLLPLHAGNVYKNVPRVTSAGDLAEQLCTSLEDGLCTKNGRMTVDRRKELYGSNIMPKPKSPSFFDQVLDAMKDFTVLTLIGAGMVSMGLELWLATKEGRDANIIESISILLAVSVVVIVTAGNNWQKERQFQALEQIQSKSFVRAVRDGAEIQLPVEDIVVGDILMLETGDILCADGVLIRGFDIKVDESHLTGESQEVSKDPQSSQALYSGSKMLSGVGYMVVTSVGGSSQSGIIANLLVMSSSSEEPKNGLDGYDGSLTREETVLQKRLALYASRIGMFGVAAAVTTTLIMSAKFSFQTFVLQGEPWNIDFLETYLEFFITGVTILVVAIPEGLPLAVTISLAYSVMKMLEDNNLVRHLSAAETMGTTTVICTDKTGTLTQNIMSVKKMWLAGVIHSCSHHFDDINSIKHIKDTLTDAIALNSTAKIYKDADGCIQKSGNKTEIALLGIIPSLGSSVTYSMDYKQAHGDTYDAFVVHQQPFTSESKRMSSIVLVKYKDGSHRLRLYIKGAAEVVLARCTNALVGDGGDQTMVCPLPSDEKEDLLSSMHGDSLRLLAVAYKDLDDMLTDEEMTMVTQSSCATHAIAYQDNIDEFEDELTLISVLGIADPLRPEVKGAIASCQRGGISVRMFTGDNLVTAASIATECGILDAADLKKPNAMVESKDFIRNITNSNDEIDGDRFRKNWEDLRVLARCSPSDKFTIVESLKRFTDEIVAVTGDGTNDAPALRIANVGFSMNDGTQIAKEAADIILVDNNFASTVSAALWGRNVYSNISKFLQFQLTVNIVALVTAAGGAIASAESPLTTVQMLWVNLIMDSLASLALATGSPDPSLLEQKPYGKDYNFVDIHGPLPKHILSQATYQLLVIAWLLGPAPDLLGIPRHISGDGPTVHHTLVFNTFVMMQLFNQLNARQINDSDNILENIENETLFQWIVCSEFALQYLIVQYGGLITSTVHLNAEEWAISIGFGMASLLLRSFVVRVL